MKILVAGIYELELKVIDNGGFLKKDTVQIGVDPVLTINRAPVTNAGKAGTDHYYFTNKYNKFGWHRSYTGYGKSEVFIGN